MGRRGKGRCVKPTPTRKGKMGCRSVASSFRFYVDFVDGYAPATTTRSSRSFFRLDPCLQREWPRPECAATAVQEIRSTE